MFQKNGKIVDGAFLVREDGRTVINPTPEMFYAEGWTDYIEVNPEPGIEKFRASVLSELLHYHSSISVCGFELDGTLTWIPTADRAALRTALEDAKERGYDEIPFLGKDRKVDDLLDMIKKVNVYALICDGVTSKHRRNIMGARSENYLEDYDYTEGYPSQLKFSF